MDHPSQRGPLATVAYYSFFLALCTSGPLAIFYAYQVIREEKQDAPAPQYHREPEPPILVPPLAATSTPPSPSLPPAVVPTQSVITTQPQTIAIVQEPTPTTLLPTSRIAKPNPIPAPAKDPRLSPEDAKHQKIAAEYAVMNITSRYKVGTRNTIPGSARAVPSSTYEDGGWGRRMNTGTVYFSYYDGLGERQDTSRRYEAITEPKDSFIGLVDIAFKD
jgi:hypothetical protein